MQGHICHAEKIGFYPECHGIPQSGFCYENWFLQRPFWPFVENRLEKGPSGSRKTSNKDLALLQARDKGS